MLSRNPVFDYLDAVYRYRLVAACAFGVGVVLTFWTLHTLPNVYRSTTLIMVEPQDVPTDFVKPTVTTRVEQRLNALSQEVLSRTRLESIIDDFGLFRALRATGAPREQVVEAMRKRIQIQVFARDNAFRISYSGADPVTVQQVAARLAGLYIDENLRIREEHVTGTTEFLANELQKVKGQLEAQEAQIRAFKQQHMGELPEQREANMRALEGLQVQLQTAAMALAGAKERKLLLEKQVTEGRATRPTGGGEEGTYSVSPALHLQELEARLSQLRSKYTAQHPDVVRTVRQIVGLRAELKKGSAAGSASDALVPPELARALAETGLEIKRLTAEKENIEKAIGVRRTRVERAFTREQELQGVTRDYEVTRKNYQAMLDKRLEAQLAQSLEWRQKGERFRVLDPASLPEAPARPNRPLLAAAGLGGSLALAFLLPILLGRLDPSFRLADEVAACGVPVLAVIPQVASPETRRRRRWYRLRVLGCTAAGLIMGLCTVSLYARYGF